MKKEKIKRKPKGYWQDINNLINHLLPVCKDLGRLPTHKELVARGEKSLFTYISRFHSLTEISEITGYEMNQKPYGYWNKESVFKEYSELLKMHHKQVPFTKRELIKLGRYDLVNAIRENYGSSENFNFYLSEKNILELKDSKKEFYYKHPKLIEEWSKSNAKNIYDCEPYIKKHKYFWECKKGHIWESSICSRIHNGRVSLCPYCSGRIIPENESLGELTPKFVKFWHKSKNKLTVFQVRPTYAVPTWWECKKGHTFRRSPAIVTKNNKFVCSICDSIKYSCAKLMKEWDWEKNSEDPSKISLGSGKRVFWKCNKGHSWDTTVAQRAPYKSGCPYCAGQRVSPTNSLEFKRPDLAMEWNFEKNKKLKPTEVTSGSERLVWWLCKNKHSYKAKIYNRNNGKGCPYCSGQKVGYGNSLADSFPKISKEFNYKKNKKITPEKLLGTSNKKIWWICKKNHEWPAVVSSRTREKNGCPYCSNYFVSKENNFATINPEKLKYFDYKKNDGISPYDYVSGSAKKVWWKCENNHSWEAPFVRISNGSGCKKCSAQTSFPEIRLFCEINSIFENINWRHKFENFEVDVLLEDYKIALEYDGWFYHVNSLSKDLKKNVSLKEKGIRIFRIRQSPLKQITNDDVIAKIKQKDLDKKYINQILVKIIQYVSKNDQKNIKKYIEKDFYSDEKEFNRIVSYLPKPIPEKSLAEINPELSKQWNYKKNYPLTPEMFEPNSGKKVWWICKKKHEWEATIDKRSNGRKCPYCSNKKVCDDNNLLALSPKISEEWSGKLNGEKTPENTLNGSAYKAWWLCKDGHYFDKKVLDRTGKRVISGERYGGCPWCRGNGKYKKYIPPNIEKIINELKK